VIWAYLHHLPSDDQELDSLLLKYQELDLVLFTPCEEAQGFHGHPPLFAVCGGSRGCLVGKIKDLKV
jgi:hypothetical protein